jgi:molybdate transport system substrate-binding protein
MADPAHASSTLRVISSMATRLLLADLVRRFEAASPWRVAVESVGGVDAAARVRAGEPFDVVVLAADVIDKLIAEQRIVSGSRVDIVNSDVAVAVRTGSRRPDIASAAALKDAVLAARTIGYSTGPSGAHIGRLMEQWGVAGAMKERIVVARPGVPVGSLVASGEIELGFQQLSELIGVDGIEVIGMLPAGTECTTTFSGGVARTSAAPDAARTLLQFMARPDVADIKRRHGMNAA